MGSPTNYTDIAQVRQLAPTERDRLRRVTERFGFRATEYYLSLINWADPDDPLRRIDVPGVRELDCDGVLDPSNEQANYVVPGCQHKYPHTALLMCTETCAAYCRYCFRKRVFISGHEIERNLDEALKYIAGNRSYHKCAADGWRSADSFDRSAPGYHWSAAGHQTCRPDSDRHEDACF